ncbi:hypothetical protein K504DRAFT_375979 [Pleomassaria siparia CBS 279.74]|uniref:Rap-GAP domain-containing protein n=1 Tax=Pleomassaria siparia CBS 279.74 TaxID=1314801 RepID=A0A6G1KD26_9PLEO|nr:hypothetical protein K504DRAFT_375979 [Pleomassaria siparia CBS 279.74]
MSPPSGEVPQTPERRSSSSFLSGAFRSLTRLRSPTPPTSSSSTTTPNRTPSLSTRRSGSVISGSGDGTINSISQHVVQTMSSGAVGGPPELEPLAAQLHSSHPLPQRLLAVDSICLILDQYPVRKVIGIWTTASDLLQPQQPDEAVAAGYKLLRSCVSLDNLATIERNVFFGAATLRSDDNHFDVRLDIISTLTRGGRNVEACEASLAPFILSSLDLCFESSRRAFGALRKVHQKKRKLDQPTQETENLARLFHFIIETCRFNSKVYSEEELEELLRKTMSMCQATKQESDIADAVKLFDAVITYMYVPKRLLKSFLEVLCIIYRQLDNLQEQSWNTLSNIFKSHIGQAAVSSLLHTLLEGPHRKSREYPVYRGVIQVLHRLLLEDGATGLPTVPISLLLPALKSSIEAENESQEEIVVGLIGSMLDEGTMREMLRNEADWSNLIYIIYKCTERDDDRTATKAAKAAGRGTMNKGTTEQSASAAYTSSPLDANPSPATARAGSVTASTGDPDGDINSTNHDPLAVPPTRSEPTHRSEVNRISKLLIRLDDLSNGVDLVQKAAIMELFMRFANRLSDFTAGNMIRFYDEQSYFLPSNGDWLEACRSLVVGILEDGSRPRWLRIACVDTLRKTYDTISSLCASDTILQLSGLLLKNIEVEEDVEILNALVDFAVDIADRASNDSFDETIAPLKNRLVPSALSSLSVSVKSPSAPWINPISQSKTDQRFGSPCNVIATAFVRLFTRSVTKSAAKTRTLYKILRETAGSNELDSDARLTILKLLFRLRADFNHALFVSASSEGESIAAVLCRTTETAIFPEEINGTASDSGRPEEHISWRDQRKVSGSSPHSSLNRQNGRQINVPGRVLKPVPPLWMYPGPKGLPEEPVPRCSGVVFSHIDAEECPLGNDVYDLEVTVWLELVISLLQKAPDWEIYSYVLAHLGPQLSNQSLVRSCVPQLQMLRNVICEQIRNSTFHEPPAYTLLKKADVAVCLFHILTVLISYHDYYEKSEEDDLVKTFLHGITFWDRTSKWCIHALTVCCHETPLSVGKSLDNIVQKMSQIVTKPSTAIHILEFLTSVARMPELYKNFREAEFKMVFGVSFRYLQHIRDQRERAATSTSSQHHRSLRHSGPSRDLSASPDLRASKKKSTTDDLPQYLYSLAYHVITFWFMGLKMEDRPKQIPWITRNLSYTDSSGRQIMEEQGQVIVDMMNMVAYSDRDRTLRDEQFAKPGDGEVWKKTWIVGHSLITIETAARTGVSMTTSRRPCGTRFLFTRPLLAPPPRHQVPLTVGLASEAFHTSSYVGILPDDIFQTYYSPLNLTDPPIPLPNDDMSRRAIASFDFNAPVDSHKVGVIYIGEGQTHEKEILMNSIGSAPYTSFLNDLGTLVRLKNAKFNTGGLDFRNDMDGEFTYCWRDRCIELIFHVPTMMPTDPDDDMTYPNKKRHIGNDYVNIIFNDSGLPYNFDTIPSAFNYVHIVITPESKASFVDKRMATDPDGKNRYYKVQVITRPEFPDISPAVEPKIVCGKYVAAYCRLIAINANVFSQVWSIREGGESVSSWRNRLREIKRLRERYGARDAPAPSPPSPVAHQGMFSPPNRESQGKPFNRTSVATFISEGTNRSSITSSSQDVAL